MPHINLNQIVTHADGWQYNLQEKQENIFLQLFSVFKHGLNGIKMKWEKVFQLNIFLSEMQK